MSQKNSIIIIVIVVVLIALALIGMKKYQERKEVVVQDPNSISSIDQQTSANKTSDIDSGLESIDTTGGVSTEMSSNDQKISNLQ